MIHTLERSAQRDHALTSWQAASAKRGNHTKIDDVSLTIFAWDNIPVTVYHQGSTAASGSNLGLLCIHTNSGLEGHAFLGSATNPALMDGPQLIRSLKPMLMGKDPLERERIHAGMRLINRTVSYRTVGAVDTAL